MAQTLSFLSLCVALAAVYVAVWQIKKGSENVARSNALPVLSDIATSWRSSELRSHRDTLLANKETPPPAKGFQDLDTPVRESAEQWCFFCEGLGLAVATNLVPEDFIISLMGTQLVEVWQAVEPLVHAERQYRANELDSDVPAEFLPHYEHLVARIIELGGREAGTNLRRKLRVKRLERPVRAYLGETTTT